jgi:hypothetical protein
MCAFLALLLAGPRAAILIWYLFVPGRWENAFHSYAFVWPLLGALFLPWTTLAFVLVAPHGDVSGAFGWVLLAMGLILDLATFASSGDRGRRYRSGVAY